MLATTLESCHDRTNSIRVGSLLATLARVATLVAYNTSCTHLNGAKLIFLVVPAS